MSTCHQCPAITDQARLRGETVDTVLLRYPLTEPWTADRNAAAVAHGYESDPTPPRATYPVELYPGCPCYTCDQKDRIDAERAEGKYAYATRMSLCPRCGSKRCAGARDHADACTPDWHES